MPFGWLWDGDMNQFMKCRIIDLFMEHKTVLLFILLYKYIIVYKILEAEIAQKYVFPQFIDLEFLCNIFKPSTPHHNQHDIKTCVTSLKLLIMSLSV